MVTLTLLVSDLRERRLRLTRIIVMLRVTPLVVLNVLVPRSVRKNPVPKKVILRPRVVRSLVPWTGNLVLAARRWQLAVFVIHFVLSHVFIDYRLSIID